MITRTLEVEVFGPDSGSFGAIRNRNVLFYWPHGFGDWVFFSYIVPLLDQSNRYFITRFGDDNTCLFDGCEDVTPLYIGVNSTHSDDGGRYGIRHFNIEESSGSRRLLRLPQSLYEACLRAKIDLVVHLPFWETHGGVAAPFHSKARQMVRTLASETTDLTARLSSTLTSALNFRAPNLITSFVEARLCTWVCSTERKLCIIGRNGYTSIGKNWGHRWRKELPEGCNREGEECRRFVELMLRKDPRWVFLSMEDRLFEGDNTLRNRALNIVSYAELFGTPDDFAPPFGLVLKALVNRANLVVGVPAGPMHLATASRNVPILGIWTEHFPSWYDEPSSNALHLLSSNLREEKIVDRIGSIRAFAGVNYRCWDLDTRVIPGDIAFAGVEELLDLSNHSMGDMRTVDHGIDAESVIHSRGDAKATAPARILVAICSCRKHSERRNAVRSTWLKNRPEGIETLFFVGAGPEAVEPGVLILPAGDTYQCLPSKVHALFRHCIDYRQFDFLFKCDDDSYVALDRLHSLVDLHADLVGDETLPSGWPCGGAGYLLSRRAVQLLADATQPADGAEDVWVGATSRSLGFRTVVSNRLQEHCHIFPRPDNDLVTAHHCTIAFMSQVYSFLHEDGALQILKHFRAQHPTWSGAVDLLADGTFLGGAAEPHGRWELSNDSDQLTLQWHHWPKEVLTATSWGYRSSTLHLITRTETAEREYQLFLADQQLSSGKLHVGCGNNLLPGWNNFDAAVDIRNRLPFSDESAQFVFAEHVVEHITPQEAFAFFREVRRILSPGGAFRIIVPCVDLIRTRYDDDYAEFIRRATGADGSLESAVESIIYRWGHQAVWTTNGLRAILESLGFETWESDGGESRFPEMKGIDGHGKVIGEHANWVESGIVEALRPS